MKAKEKKDVKFEIPKEVQDEAKSLIRKAFDLFKRNAERLNKEIDDFDREFDDATKRIRAGGRKTSGRIV